MKLSIWQQFSSNNSSGFNLVGHFRSINESLIAYEEIVSLLMFLSEWYERPENDHLRRRMGPPLPFKGEQITPIEQDYSERFAIEWGDPIDWVCRPSDVRKAVRRFGRLVMLRTGFEIGDTFMGCHPISTLMARLGGDAYCNGFEVTVTAMAPELSSGHETLIMRGCEGDNRFVVEPGSQVIFHITHFYDLRELLEQLEKHRFTRIEYQFNNENF